MPEFRVLNRLGSVKAGARVVAAVGDARTQQYPALVVQRFGNGRTAALTIGDIWRWGLRQPEMRDDMNKFWRQMLRWLVADVPEPISLRAVRKAKQANEFITLQVHARSKDFEPMDNISVAIEVSEPGGQKVRLTAEPVPGESGLLEATHVPRVSGGYFARAVVSSPERVELGGAETGWAVDLEAREFRSIRANRPLLEKIARQTAGQVVELDDLKDFARSLPGRKVPITTAWVRPFWDLPGVLPAIFLFVLICFAGEWALRRWKGMP